MIGRVPFARWVGTPNFTPRGMIGVPHGISWHRTAGSMPGSLNWLQNPRSQASAHLINPHSGGLLQLVDLNDKAWAQANGNPFWISVEHEGWVGDGITPTPSQIENDIALTTWLHETIGMPLVVTDNPGAYGIVAHCDGGSGWGGHPDCPGPELLGARGLVVARAGGSAPAPSPAPAPVNPGDIYSVEAIVTALPTLSQGSNGQYVKILQGLLIANGRQVSVDGDFGPDTASKLREWQGACQIGADGICGPVTWRRLHCI